MYVCVYMCMYMHIYVSMNSQYRTWNGEIGIGIGMDVDVDVDMDSMAPSDDAGRAEADLAGVDLADGVLDTGVHFGAATATTSSCACSTCMDASDAVVGVWFAFPRAFRRGVLAGVAFSAGAKSSTIETEFLLEANGVAFSLFALLIELLGVLTTDESGVFFPVD